MSKDIIKEQVKLVVDDGLQRKFCQYCGKEIDENSMFCKYCGRSVRTVLPDNAYKNKSWLLKFKSVFKIAKTEENESLSKKHKLCLSVVILVSVLISISSLFVYFWGEGFINYFRSVTPYNLIMLSVIISIILIIFYLVLSRLCKKVFNRHYVVIDKIFIGLIIVCAIVEIVCSIDILCTGEAKTRYFLEKKLSDQDSGTKNKEILEVYKILVDEYGYDQMQYVMDDNYNVNKLFRSFRDAISTEARKGNPLAQGIYGEYLMSRNNWNPSNKDREHAYYWFKAAAQKNDSRGLYRLGNCYANILKIPHVEKDIKLAYDCWVKASKKDYAPAFLRLGDLYGTWEIVNALRIPINGGNVYGLDLYQNQFGGYQYSKPYNMPINFRHDIKLARRYWRKALSIANEGSIPGRKEIKLMALERLEKVYPEEETE